MASYKESDIMYENDSHWVLKVKIGFEVYRKTITHSVRCGIFGRGEHYLNRAKEHANQRDAALKADSLKNICRYPIAF